MAHILVVDDDAEIRDLIADVLTLEGHAALAAGDGVEALAVVADSPVDLVVADVVMPRCTGPELVARLRAQGRRTPVLLVSGNVRSVPDLEGVAYLAKPFDLDALIARIDVLLGGC